MSGWKVELDYEVRAHALDGDTLWLGTKAGGLYAIQLGTRSSERVGLAGPTAIRALTVHKGRVLCGLEDGRVVSAGRGVQAPPLPELPRSAPPPVRDLTSTGEALWVLRDDRVDRLSDDSDAWAPTRIHHPASWMFAAQGGVIVFCDDGTVLRVDTTMGVHPLAENIAWGPTNVIEFTCDSREDTNERRRFLVTQPHGLDLVTLSSERVESQETVFSGRVTAACTVQSPAPTLFVATRGGKIFSSTWSERRPSSDWRRWDECPTDVDLIVPATGGETLIVALRSHHVAEVKVTGAARTPRNAAEAEAEFARQVCEDTDPAQPLQRRHDSRTLHQELLAGARKAQEPEERTRLVAQARMLQKYGVDAHTFFAKDLNLGALVDANRDRPLDRLIYQARLDEQGYDRLEEQEFDGVVTALACDERGTLYVGHKCHRDCAAVTSLANGQKSSEDYVKGRHPTLLLPRKEGYRVWTRRDGRSGDAGSQAGTARAPDGTDVYAALMTDDKPTMLGLSRHQLRIDGGELKQLTPPRGGASHAVGNRRIRVLIPFGVGQERVIVGTEAGALYEVSNAGQGRRLAFIGSPIWSGARLDDSSFVVGTADGDVLFFRYTRDPSADSWTLRLRARDCLFHLVGALFVHDGEDRKVVAVCVDGLVATYAASASSKDVEPHPPAHRVPFPGMRLSRARVVQGQVTAAALVPGTKGPELWVAHRRAQRHCVSRVRLATPSADARPLQERAPFTRRRQAGLPTQASAASVLRSIPARTGCLRGAAARIELADVTDPDRAELGRRFEASLCHHPSSRTEFKAILDAVRTKMAPFWSTVNLSQEGVEVARRWFSAVSESLVALPGWRSDPKLKAAVARKILCPAAFGPSTAGNLQAWIQQHLEDPSPLVRLETLQALADSLHIIHVRSLRDACFPRPADIATILVPVAQFLGTNPVAATELSATPAAYWTALIVVRHLIQLFPEATWSIADHLVVCGVGRSGLLLLAETLRPADRARLYRFTPPSAVGATPSTKEVVQFLVDIVSASLPSETHTPDARFDAARRTLYKWFLTGFGLGTYSSICAHIRRLPGKPAAQRTWSLDASGQRHPHPELFTFVSTFLAARVAPLDAAGGAEDLAAKLRTLAADIEAIDARPGDLDAAAADTEPIVYDPEAPILVALCKTWAASLLRAVLLPGDVVGTDGGVPSEDAGRWFSIQDDGPTRSSWLVCGAAITYTEGGGGAAKERPTHMIRSRPVSGGPEERALIRSEVTRVWDLLRAAGGKGNGLPTIDLVLQREWSVVMVMKNAGAPLRGTFSDDAHKAEKVLEAVSSALLAIHDAHLWHGDIRPENIVERDGNYTLVDFGHTGPVATPTTATEIQPNVYATFTPAWWQYRREPKDPKVRSQQADLLMLCDIVTGTRPATESQGSPLRLARAVREGDIATTRTVLAASSLRPNPLASLVARLLLPPLAGTTRVFVSYTRVDAWSRLFVEAVRGLSHLPGVQLFFDELVEPGTRWNSTIHNQLADADIVVVCMSSHWLVRPYIRDEEQKLIVGHLERGTARVLLLPAGVTAARDSPLFALSQAAWSLDDPPDERDPVVQARRLADGIRALLAMVGQLAGQER